MKPAAQIARKKGIVIADTKLESGLVCDDTVVLMDEVLAPDSPALLADLCVGLSWGGRGYGASCQ